MWGWGATPKESLLTLPWLLLLELGPLNTPDPHPGAPSGPGSSLCVIPKGKPQPQLLPWASPWPLTAVLTQRKPISRRHQQRGWGPRGEVCRHGKAREGAPVWALGSITTNKAGGGDGIPVELFQILKDDAVKVLHSVCCAYCAYVLRLCLSGIRSVSSASLCLCSFPFWTLNPQSGGQQGAHKPLDRTRWKRAGGPLAEYF